MRLILQRITLYKKGHKLMASENVSYSNFLQYEVYLMALCTMRIIYFGL